MNMIFMSDVQGRCLCSCCVRKIKVDDRSVVLNWMSKAVALTPLRNGEYNQMKVETHGLSCDNFRDDGNDVLT